MVYNYLTPDIKSVNEIYISQFSLFVEDFNLFVGECHGCCHLLCP